MLSKTFLFDIRRCSDLNPEELEPLIRAARGEGYRILDRLVEEWQSESNRFDAPGEAYFGAYRNERLVGVGGVNRLSERTGRVRRVFVLPSERGAGAGSQLVLAVIHASAGYFDQLVLRSQHAGHFYESLGFTSTGLADPTHIFELRIQ